MWHPWYGRSWLFSSLVFFVFLFFSSAVLHADEEDPDSQEPQTEALTIGSQAPSLKIEHWFSHGNPEFGEVTGFEKDKVYVIEFWATWCGPCLSSMPHLADLQTQYAPHDVQIISISDESEAKVQAFLKKDVRKRAPTRSKESDATEDDGDPKEEEAVEPATYRDLTSAYSLTTDPDRSSHFDYMKAAGQNGIPTSFIVGKTGLIEWIGHPMSMDQPLQAVVDDKWDRDSFAVEFMQKQAFDLALRKVSSLIRRNEYDAALELLQKAQSNSSGRNQRMAEFYYERYYQRKLKYLSDNGQADVALSDVETRLQTANEKEEIALRKHQVSLLLELGRDQDAIATLNAFIHEWDAMSLNAVAWAIYEQFKDAKETNPDVLAKAIEVAEAAIETAPQQPAVLDTLAHLVYLSGDAQRAFDIQSRAVKLSKRVNPSIKAFHQKLKAELADESESENGQEE